MRAISILVKIYLAQSQSFPAALGAIKLLTRGAFVCGFVRQIFRIGCLTQTVLSLRFRDRKIRFFTRLLFARGATCTVGCAHSSPYQKLSSAGSSTPQGQFYTQSLLRQKQFCTAKAHGFSTADLLCLKLFYSVVGFDRVLWQNICFLYACLAGAAVCTVGCAHSSPYQKLSCVGSSATHGFCIKLLFDVNFAEIIRYVFARAFTEIFPSQRLAWSQNALKTPSL